MKMLKSKKGFDVGGLYQFVLLIVLVGLISGVGVLLLDKLGGSSSVTTSAQTSINASRDAVADIPEDWLGLIVLIGVMAVILALVIGSFARRR